MTARARRGRRGRRAKQQALNAPVRAVQRAMAAVDAPRRGKRAPVRVLGRPSWKLVGLAGIAGVAATGVVVARNRRAHSDLPPDELRERLHERLAAVGAAAGPAATAPHDGPQDPPTGGQPISPA